MSNKRAMKVLVVGLGSIGRRHIKNLKTLDPSLQIAVLRQHSKDRDVGDVATLVSDVFIDQDHALAWSADIVVIANPAPRHLETALLFAHAGAHLFIEKPLADTVQGIEQLQEVCRDKNLIVMVGYVLRFAQPLQMLAQEISQGKIGKILSIEAHVGRFLPHWRPGGDYRKQVTSQRNLGGGVILELSHEIDYVRWLAGEVLEVSAMAEKVSDFEIDVEDLAGIQLRLANGVLGHIHLDMIDHAARRGCRIIGSKGTLLWEAQGSVQKVCVFNGDAGKWHTLMHEENVDTNVMHLAQWAHFFKCISLGQQPLVNLEVGAKVLRIAEASLQSAREHTVIKL